MLKYMEFHLSQASQHCLNLCPKNLGLQKVSQVHEATVALKQQAHIENLNMFVSIYLCPPDNSKAAKKVCPLAMDLILIRLTIIHPVSHSTDTCCSGDARECRKDSHPSSHEGFRCLQRILQSEQHCDAIVWPVCSRCHLFIHSLRNNICSENAIFTVACYA